MRALIFLLLVAVFCATMTSADQGNFLKTKFIMKQAHFCFSIPTGQIKFKISGMPGNSEWNYSTTPGITVFGLKQLLQMPTNTPPAEQSLKLNGNEMIDSNTLKSYNLQENTVLNWSRK